MSITVDLRSLAKGWKFFDIMHKDRRVARIYENGKCTILYPSFMPYNLYLEKSDELDARINNLTNFYYWCSSRVLALDRKYAKEIFNAIGAKQAVTDRERAAVAASYHGLSLTDVFWIRAAGEKTDFKTLNLYDHSLSDAFADVCLRGKNMTVQNTELITFKEAAGDVGTQGIAPKAWIREGENFYLLKDGDERDVDAELLASKIAECFKVDCVTYEESYFDNTRVTKCKIITSEERSIVPYEYIDIYCANSNENALEFVVKKDAYSYYMMNIIDYLVGNVDRHWGNWGFIADNSHNKLLGLYPLMDFNKSFFAYDTVDGSICQTTDRKREISQREAAIEAVEKIGLNMISEVKAEWFADTKTREMFCKRLSILQEVDLKRSF